jgi:hypothetical protein
VESAFAIQAKDEEITMNKTAAMHDINDASGFGSATEERLSEPTTMMSCPMARMCQGMISGSGSGARFGLFLLVPGLLLFLIGVAILFEPQVLVWVVGGAAILFGSLLIGFGIFLRRLGSRIGMTG